MTFAAKHETARPEPVGAYTVALLAKHWGVSDTFVYEQINGGRLKSFKLGNKLIRIRPEWVSEYELQACQVGGAAAAQPAIMPVPAKIAARLARLAR